MLSLSTTIDLTGQEPIARGTYRDVFAHPLLEECVVKVLRAGAHIRPGRPLRNLLKASSLRQRYRFMFREYDEYLSAMLRSAATGERLPLAQPLWLQQTTIGIAMVAARVRGSGPGGSARSLGSLVSAGRINADEIALLNEFIGQVYHFDIIVNDTNPENVLLEEHGVSRRFVLVDGFGDTSPFQIKRTSRRLRDHQRERRFRLMAAQIGCNWNSRLRRLEFRHTSLS